jgi:hypothetical protein
VYELTARGDELFHHLLESEDPKAETGRDFALRWAFARYMSPETRLLLLQRRRAQLLADREGSRRAVESPWRPLDRYQRSLVDHATEATEHDLSWIDRLIAAEQTAQVSSPAPSPPVRPTQPVADPAEVVNASIARAHEAQALTQPLKGASHE